jgi:hypothetical protein
MNTDRLAKYYNCFSPWERLPLIVAASARGDEVERDRLARSAPTVHFRLPNYWGLANGLRQLTMLYALEQLDRAAAYWWAKDFLKAHALLGYQSLAPDDEERISKLLAGLALCFVLRADTWKLLCAELHLDPEVLLRELPGYQRICDMEKEARATACTPEEAVASLREATVSCRLPQEEATATFRIATPEDMVRPLREFLQEQLDAWS